VHRGVRFAVTEFTLANATGLVLKLSAICLKFVDGDLKRMREMLTLFVNNFIRLIKLTVTKYLLQVQPHSIIYFDILVCIK